MADAKAPAGLNPGGRALWRKVTEAHTLDAMQEVQLLEACRAKDRLDRFDMVLRGDVETWAKVAKGVTGDEYELKIDAALSQANATANLLKQLLAALRLPDEATGKKPQVRSARGAYKPSGTVSSLERARQAKNGA